MITVNGKSVRLTKCNLIEYLKEQGYHTQRVVAELNGKIIPKSEYENTALKEGDVLEVLSFVGGG